MTNFFKKKKNMVYKNNIEEFCNIRYVQCRRGISGDLCCDSSNEVMSK